MTARDTGEFELASKKSRYFYGGWLAGLGLVFAYGFLFLPSRFQELREGPLKQQSSDTRGTYTRIKNTAHRNTAYFSAILESENDFSSD